MPYVQHTAEDQQEMLRAIGVRRIEVAAGAWSRELTRRLGHRVPGRRLTTQSIATAVDLSTQK